MTPAERRPGQIITFYSYKGGTGRSMALANVAWILAANRKRVFVIDWDLEAPGLHRYFRPFLIDKELTGTDGLIDIVHGYVDQAIGRWSSDTDTGSEEFKEWVDGFADIASESTSLDFPFPDGGFIDFLPAGRQIAAYAERVNTFNWNEFYKRFGGGVFLEAVKRRLRQDYDYILIDSRTGVSDTSGISTVQMPDVLAVCFTYNNQSIAGASAIARSVGGARAQLLATRKDLCKEDALPPEFRMFPIPTRVEQGERAKLRLRQNYARREFDSLLTHIPEHLRESYWSDVEVPYIPYHAYEETLAALTDNPSDLKLILAAVKRITGYLTGGEVGDYLLAIDPEAVRGIIREFAETPGAELPDKPIRNGSADDEQDIDMLAEAQLAQVPLADLPAAQRLWKRLVQLRTNGASQVLATWVVLYSTLPADEKRVATHFISGKLLRSFREADGAEYIEVANDTLLRRWKTLMAWVEQDRQFILWRQQVIAARQEWTSNLKPKNSLLSYAALDESVRWLGTHEAEILPDERDFIEASLERDGRKTVRRSRQQLGMSFVAGGMVVGGLIVLLLHLEIKYFPRAQKWPPPLPVEQAANAPAPTVQLEAQPQPAPALSGPEYTEQAAPVDTAPRNSRLAVNKVLAERQRRDAILLIYFSKSDDPPNVMGQLSTLGYHVEPGRSRNGHVTNTVWFGCQGQPNNEDVHRVVGRLMRMGLQIRKLEIFPGSNRQLALIHVGAEPTNADKPPLTKEQAESFDLRMQCKLAGVRTPPYPERAP